MLLKNIFYILLLFVSGISLITLIGTIINKNKYISKNLLAVSIAEVISFYLLLYYMNRWYFPFGLEVLYIYVLMLIAFIIYIISIIINIVKIVKGTNNSINIYFTIVAIVIVILPFIVIFSSYSYIKDKISDSDLIVIYEANGNGGFGDSDTFAYAVSGDECFQFDLGIDVGGYRMNEFLPDTYEEINVSSYDEMNFIVGEYTVPFYDYNEHKEDLFIYKYDKEVCKVNTDMYFNIELETVFK